jgi:hypothetical protein
VTYCYKAAEFGSANLLTADPVEQTRFGMLAGMVIEPKGACWASVGSDGTTANKVDPGCDKNNYRGNLGVEAPDSANVSADITGTTAMVYFPDLEAKDPIVPAAYFREFVLMAQDSIYNYDNGMFGFNYASEPMGDKGGKEQGHSARYSQNDPNDPQRKPIGGSNVACGYANLLANVNDSYTSTVGGVYTPLGEPETPIFKADPGDPTRFRVMQPNGGDQHVFELFGHVWQEEPYNNDSTVISNNPTSQWQGSRMGLSATDRFDIVLPSAGGVNKVPGDYLYRSFPGGDLMNGMWGIFRVGESVAATSDNICQPSGYGLK